jgi:demethylmenaquinone methyltransferase / 2-methoxy-6-polyprenyl-1,4-benzoquinol methylase
VVQPYKTSDNSKKEQVALMFNNIAKSYDFLNHFLSFNIDKMWRRKAIHLLKPFHPLNIIDIATGTGDFAIEAMRLQPSKIMGIDISEEMLAIGREKMKKKKLEQWVQLQKGDSENLLFDTGTFDAAIVAFGIRNFENLTVGLKEINRVLKPGGAFVVLEFSTPRHFPVKQLYHIYSSTILPLTGRLISRDKSAYKYLPESVEAFPSGDKMADILKTAGFDDVSYQELSFGIATVYLAIKKI